MNKNVNEHSVDCHTSPLGLREAYISSYSYGLLGALSLCKIIAEFSFKPVYLTIAVGNSQIYNAQILYGSEPPFMRY